MASDPTDALAAAAQPGGFPGTPLPSLWRNHDYMLLWTGQLVSQLGSGVSQIAYPLLLLALTHSPAKAGFAGALYSLPYLLFSLPAGALVDRWDRKRVMILCDAGRALALGSIPIAYALGHLTLAQLYVTAATEGTLFVFFNIAEVACLPRVVPGPQIPTASAQNEGGMIAAQLIAPPLGGILYAVARSIPFAVDAISYLASVISLSLIRTTFQEERTAVHRSLRREIVAGQAPARAAGPLRSAVRPQRGRPGRASGSQHPAHPANLRADRLARDWTGPQHHSRPGCRPGSQPPCCRLAPALRSGAGAAGGRGQERQGGPDLGQMGTIVDIARWRARYQEHRLAYVFLDSRGNERQMTYGELHRRAGALADTLHLADAAGERALLLCPPGLEYIVAFLSYLYAGVVAVPAYPPRPNKGLARMQAIMTDARTRFVIAPAEVHAQVQREGGAWTPGWEPQWIITHALSPGTDRLSPGVTVTGADLAFLQYTSGSTGAPRGVMVSHDNLMCNSQMIDDYFRHTPESVGVNWLPPYHDMGLVGTILQPLYVGFLSVLMSPVTFLQRPIRWLQAISHYHGTTCGGLNFAFEWCVQRVNPEQCADLDLSSWSCAYVGAEPNRLRTFQRFCERFGQYGFRWESLLPVYGLAEATLLVSGVPRQCGPHVESFDARGLAEGRVRKVAATDSDARCLVGSGRPHPSLQVEVVQPESLERCPPDRIGEIWVSGPSVTRGYWNLPEESCQSFQAHLQGEDGSFLRTGDLGFMLAGDLFVAGRLKDVIIIAGLKHYPNDIEATVEASHPAVRPTGAAAFSVEERDEERLIILAEIDHRRMAAQRATSTPEAIERAIRRAVAEEHEVTPLHVVLLKSGSLPKTSSGKIQRHACRARYFTGSLDVWLP